MKPPVTQELQDFLRLLTDWPHESENIARLVLGKDFDEDSGLGNWAHMKEKHIMALIGNYAMGLARAAEAEHKARTEHFKKKIKRLKG